MLFKIVATIYLLMNGQPVGEPQKMTNKIDFATLEDCVAGKETEIIQKSLARLNAFIDEQTPAGGSHTTTVSCEQHDDGSI